LRVHLIERGQRLAVPPERAFGLFAEAGNLEAITPPWLRFRIVTPGAIEMRPGALIEYRLTLHRVAIRWLSRIEVWEPPRRFVDLQVRGPFALWEHTHSFEAAEGGTLMCDRIRYRLRWGPLGGIAHLAFVRRDLERIFDYRGEAIGRVLPGTLSSPR
jgi:ligand-binding SRPBCC domain-containing protein